MTRLQFSWNAVGDYILEDITVTMQTVNFMAWKHRIIIPMNGKVGKEQVRKQLIEQERAWRE